MARKKVDALAPWADHVSCWVVCSMRAALAVPAAPQSLVALLLLVKPMDAFMTDLQGAPVEQAELLPCCVLMVKQAP